MYKSIVLISILLLVSGCAKSDINVSKKQIDKRCLQKAQTGKCRAFFKRYYFKQETQKCEEFIWGGCQGSVPFKTLKECRKTCED